MGLPGPHPAPPFDLHSRRLPIRQFEGDLYRTHSFDWEPLFFGRSGSKRFDDPIGQYGVLYAATDPYGSFVESFGQVGTSLISSSELKTRGLAHLAARRPLRFVDLTEPGALARVGADSRLFAGDYDIAQLWSRSFYDCPLPLLDGLLYPARHDHTRTSAAIFDRAEGLDIVERRRWYDDGDNEANSIRPLLGAILDHYGFRIIETVARPRRKGPRRSLQASLFDE
jgi:RES domain